MTERSGLGETGETYLVGQDKLMRSDSHLDPVNHSVIGSFKNPSRGSAETDTIRNALAGQTDADILKDYNDAFVLSAYAPVKVGDLTWAVMSEIDMAEAFAPKFEGARWVKNSQWDNDFYSAYIEKYGYYDLFLIDPDKLMRSDSFIDPQNHSVDASFDNPSSGDVDTDAAKGALKGETNAKIIIDYTGNPVLSAFRDVQ